MALTDFELLYQEYVKQWTKKNRDRIKKSENPEDFVCEIYEEWRNTPCAEIGGISPAKFFEKLTAGAAIDLFKEYLNEDIIIPSPLYDKLSECDCEDELIGILKDSSNRTELLITAADTLKEKGCEKLNDILAGILTNPSYDADVRETAAEILSDNAASVEKKLLDKINTEEIDENSRYIADVLVYAKGKQKVYNLLVRLFESGINNQLYAAYLGMYEDPRAIPVLEKRLYNPELGYAEFLEIRNSIERLGGEVSLMKDFSDDPDFKALKNLR